MEIVDRGTICAGRKDSPRSSLAFPGICVLPGGRWLCTYRAARIKEGSTEATLLTWSDDSGKTWREPARPWPAPGVGGRIGSDHCGYCTALDEKQVLAVVCWVDRSEPDLPFFNEDTEGLLDCRIMLSESPDAGETWSEPGFVDAAPFYGPVPITGPVFSLANGDLGCQFELNKSYYEPTEWRHSSVLKFSADGGKTWPEYVITSNDPQNRVFHWDQRPGVLADGRILNLFWSYDKQAGVYLNIHARESTDNGRTWSPMWDTGVPGQPATPVSMPDGRVAMVHVNRTSAPAIEVRTSDDMGRTWPEETRMVLYDAGTDSQTRKKTTMQDAWAEIGNYSVGLPATAVTADSDVLVVYYAGAETDRTDIQWVRVKA